MKSGLVFVTKEILQHKSAARPAPHVATWVFASLLVAFAATPVAAQEHDPEDEAAEHSEARPRHRLAFFTGNTWIHEEGEVGAVDGLIAAPTIGIDYAFRFSERFAVGSINDLILDSYVIVLEDGSELERELAVVTSVVVMWRATHRLQLFAGPGIEADKHETLTLLKVGLEWDIFEPHPWDVALNVAADIKGEYNALAVGLSIGRLWK
jgi:hypothetical protein